jgi:hypothetical protein
LAGPGTSLFSTVTRSSTGSSVPSMAKISGVERMTAIMLSSPS